MISLVKAFNLKIVENKHKHANKNIRKMKIKRSKKCNGGKNLFHHQLRMKIALNILINVIIIVILLTNLIELRTREPNFQESYMKAEMGKIKNCSSYCSHFFLLFKHVS